jgi:hypothetical protein
VLTCARRRRHQPGRQACTVGVQCWGTWPRWLGEAGALPLQPQPQAVPSKAKASAWLIHVQLLLIAVDQNTNRKFISSLSLGGTRLDPSPREVEAGRSKVPGQPGPHGKPLSCQRSAATQLSPQRPAWPGLLPAPPHRTRVGGTSRAGHNDFAGDSGVPLSTWEASHSMASKTQ